MKLEIKEPTRKLAVWAVSLPPKASQTAPSPHQNSRLRGGSVEGAKYRETVVSNMRNEDARSLGVQPLRGTQASCRILCVAGHARARTEWHATTQHVRVIGVGLSRRSQSEPTRAAFAAPPPEEREQSIVEDVRREIAAITERRAKTSAQATPGAMGLPEKAANAGREGLARAASGAGAPHKLPPACGPQEKTDDTCHYTCPFCEAAVSSSVRSGRVDHRRHCGNRFQVKDGCVVTKKMVYQCPFCDGKVSSNVMTGQVNHGSVCGSWFYVKTGRVSDATRKHRHTCPRCQAAVWSACASGRIRVQHNTPAGRPCTQRSWKSEEKKEA